MTQKLQNLLSQSASGLRRNPIREILKVVSQPGMISLAGGIPAPETFPIEDLYRINETVLDRYGAAALQYDLTEGFAPFREALAGYLATKCITADAEQLLVFNGSQSILDTLGKVLISPGRCGGAGISQLSGRHVGLQQLPAALRQHRDRR